jgi:large subunit ribosomal protein L15
MPLQRRLPKRGFTNIFKKEWLEVNLAELDKRFDKSEEVTPELMAERGMIKRSRLARSAGVVVLGKGSLSKALNVTAHRFSKSAREKIEAAGGRAATVAAPVAGASNES